MWEGVSPVVTTSGIRRFRVERARRSGWRRLRGVSPLLFGPAFGSAAASSARARCRTTCRRGLAPVRVRRSIDPPRARGTERWPTRALGGLACPRFRECSARQRSTPPWLGRRTPHRSRGDVSLLFHSRRSPAPGLRPVTCPAGGGTFLMPRGTGAGLPLPGGTTPQQTKSVVTWRRDAALTACRVEERPHTGGCKFVKIFATPE